MKTKGKKLDGIVFTDIDPRYAGKLDDPHGSDTTMLMQQVREVMTVNQEMKDESNWIWLTSEQMRSEGEHQSTSPRKCVQQKWSSTGKTADAVGSAFQTAGR